MLGDQRRCVDAQASGRPGRQIVQEDVGTGDERAAEEFVKAQFDFRPRAIVERLNMLRPIYRQTTNYGHFGRPGLPWEDVTR